MGLWTTFRRFVRLCAGVGGVVLVCCLVMVGAYGPASAVDTQRSRPNVTPLSIAASASQWPRSPSPSSRQWIWGDAPFVTFDTYLHWWCATHEWGPLQTGVKPWVLEEFKRLDWNRDGRVSQTEFVDRTATTGG